MMILSLRYFLNMFQRARLAPRSIPEVGSSRRTSFDYPIKAIETESFLLFPPEREPDLLFLSIVKPTSRTISLISFYLSLISPPLSSKNKSKCSMGVRSSNKTSCYGQTPIFSRTFYKSLKISLL